MANSASIARLSFLASLLFACACAGLAAQAAESSIDSGVTLFIDSNPRGALVEINGTRAGVTPLSLNNYAPGSYSLRLSLAGYHDRLIDLNAVDKTKYSYLIDLEPRLGTLFIEASPANAHILVDGAEASAGKLALGVGRHLVSARLFGYGTQERAADISEDSPCSLSFSLEKAGFALGGAALSRRRLNPLARGSLGASVFSFTVSAPGTASLTISSSSGTVVARHEFDFKEWEQAFRWDGRDPSGAPLPDGDYAISLNARGDDGCLATLEDRLTIDAAARIEPRSLSTGQSGYALCPAAAILPSGDGEVSAGFSFPLASEYSSAVFPCWTGLRFSVLDPLELSVSLHGAVGPGSSSGVAISANAKWRFLSRGRANGFDAAAYLGGVAALPGPLSQIFVADSGSALRLGLPCSATLGIFDACIAPEFSLSFPASSQVLPRVSLSAALGIQAPFGDIHLSANAKYLVGAAALDGPILTALDARFLASRVPVSLGAGFGLSIGLDGSLAPSISASLSLLI